MQPATARSRPAVANARGFTPSRADPRPCDRARPAGADLADVAQGRRGQGRPGCRRSQLQQYEPGDRRRDRRPRGGPGLQHHRRRRHCRRAAGAAVLVGAGRPVFLLHRHRARRPRTAQGQGVPRLAARRGGTPTESYAVNVGRGVGGGARAVGVQPIVELNAPPSSSKFWPTMNPEEEAHRKAQASPNSAGSPTRPVGLDWPRLASISSKEMFCRRASYSMPERSRSVRNGPGSRPLIVTLYLAICRAMPAQKAVRPVRAPLLIPRLAIGDLTEPEVMLTMRPKRRSHMPSTVDLISMIGVSMLALTAFCQSSTDHSRKSPWGGPPQLLTRMSGAGQAASAAARPASVEMSPATAVTLAPVSLRISSAVCSRVSWVRAVITNSTPARPSAVAQARPSPLLAAQTMALRPRMRKSSISSSALVDQLSRMGVAWIVIAGDRKERRERRPNEADPDFRRGARRRVSELDRGMGGDQRYGEDGADDPAF